MGDRCWISAPLLAAIVAIGRPELAPTNGLAGRPFHPATAAAACIASLTLKSLNGVVGLISFAKF